MQAARRPSSSGTSLDTLRRSQALMAVLLQKDVRSINEHALKLYAEGELAPEATIRKLRIVRQEEGRVTPGSPLPLEVGHIWIAKWVRFRLPSPSPLHRC